MEIKAKIMDEKAVGRALARITHEIIEKNQGCENICLLGIKSKGIPLAKLLAENIEKFEGVKVPLGIIDITKYRDDISEAVKQELADGCSIPCDITDKIVIMVDDVLHTGRTVRAAMESVFAYGRPMRLQFAVLVDRGHRELPIRADYVGKNLPTSENERVLVKVDETNNDIQVYIGEK